ncbi:MAG: hypothetical protein ACE5HZ_07015 [Fidelibacterota bacterium]
MKKTAAGFFLGVMLSAGLFALVAAPPVQEDSIRIYMDRLEQVIRDEIAQNITAGRFQLQSFSIERTHWHYMLDTSTGELYRMELGRTPDRSDWVLMATGMIEPVVPEGD